MDGIYYKKLFEVRVLHEYYLSEDTAFPYFALPEAERKSILQNRMFHKQYDINQDISILPSEDCKKLFRDYHIRFVPQKTGFFAGIRINAGGPDFTPFIPQHQELLFSFELRIRNPYIINFTNIRLQPVVPAQYLFSNADPGGTKTSPSLSEPVAPFKSGTFYEMGELARSGADIREAIVRTNSNQNTDWRKINSQDVANESDRLLLPMQFRYAFDKNKNVTQASFTLKQNANTIKTIAIAGAGKLENVYLDFRTNSSSPPQETANGFYDLEVSGDNGYQDKRKLYLHNELYNTRNFGAIVIQNSSSGSDFSIFTHTGKLKVPHPVFEVRLKSRITYWRYKSEQGKSFTVTPKTSPYLSAENGALRSIHPIPMLSTPVEFKDETAAAPKIFLPNPSGNTLRIEPNGLVYSDIYLSKIKDLIAEA
ncbi:hypothetical protein [Pontibacter pamirensis]|uniref:hypothetical protein n=1 Tax=Pontibacter pamirensis TaxID=2562824 RepID=UPI001389BC86|nr:hypothetical protein [Pontibacter pamirensis]